MAIPVKRPMLTNACEEDSPAENRHLRNMAEVVDITGNRKSAVRALVGKALQLPEVRHLRVDDLRQKLANRQYRLDSRASAAAMIIVSHLELPDLKPRLGAVSQMQLRGMRAANKVSSNYRDSKPDSKTAM